MHLEFESGGVVVLFQKFVYVESLEYFCEKISVWPMAYEFYPDKTQGERFFTVFEQRLQLLEHLGVTQIKVGDYCHRLNYRQCIVDIIVSSDEADLHRNYNESWWEMGRTVENFSASRLRGRDCYHAVKDICIDGLFADLIVYFMKEQHPDFDFCKNAQDKVFDLLPKVSLAPDFVVCGAKLEMKIAKTVKDGDKRANWTRQTLTIRQDDLDAQLFSYYRYRPLWFLRINYEEKAYSVINYDDFRKSHKNDGSYFAYIAPKPIPADFRSFVDSLYAELSGKLHLTNKGKCIKGQDIYLMCIHRMWRGYCEMAAMAEFMGVE